MYEVLCSEEGSTFTIYTFDLTRIRYKIIFILKTDKIIRSVEYVYRRI